MSDELLSNDLRGKQFRRGHRLENFYDTKILTRLGCELATSWIRVGDSCTSLHGLCTILAHNRFIILATDFNV